MKHRLPKYLVANPGTHPEPAHLAAGLLNTGESVAYLTSATWSSDSAAARLAMSRVGRWVPLASLVRGRILPKELTSSNVHKLAQSEEFAFQLARRIKPSIAPRLLKHRSEQYRRRSVSWLNGSAARDVEVVIAQQTAALELFEAASTRVTRVLLYPIAHHRWMAEHLGRESRRNPTWAPFMQGSQRAPEELVRLDREVELADLIIVPSTFTASTFAAASVSPDRLIVAPLGVAPASTIAPLPASPSELRILYVGQINERKGMSYLLSAFAAADLPSAVLRLIGPFEPAIAPLVNAFPRVQLVGTRSREQLNEEFASADVFVFPSLAEGFGLAALEAMSAGLPCIVSDRTFGTDVITDGVDGFIIPAKDSAALAERLHRLAADPNLRRRLGSAAHQTSLAFSWDKYQQSTARALQRALDTLIQKRSVQ